MKGNNPWVNNLVGSAAEMTFVKAADGDMIAKGKIQEMTNPNTASQQAVRSAFQYYSQMGSAILAFLNQYFEKPGPMQSPYNGFVSESMKEQLQSDEDEPTEEDYSRLAVPTNGPLYNANIIVTDPSAVTTVDGFSTQIGLSWNYDAGSEIQDGTDKLYFLELNGDTFDWQSGHMAGIRSDGSSFLIPNIPSSGWNVIVMFFVSETSGKTHRAMPLFQVDDQGNVLYRQEDWA